MLSLLFMHISQSSDYGLAFFLHQEKILHFTFCNLPTYLVAPNLSSSYKFYSN